MFYIHLANKRSPFFARTPRVLQKGACARAEVAFVHRCRELFPFCSAPTTRAPAPAATHPRAGRCHAIAREWGSPSGAPKGGRESGGMHSPIHTLQILCVQIFGAFNFALRCSPILCLPRALYPPARPCARRAPKPPPSQRTPAEGAPPMLCVGVSVSASEAGVGDACEDGGGCVCVCVCVCVCGIACLRRWMCVCAWVMRVWISVCGLCE